LALAVAYAILRLRNALHKCQQIIDRKPPDTEDMVFAGQAAHAANQADRNSITRYSSADRAVLLVLVSIQ